MAMYYILFYFLIYAFLGWVLETIYASIRKKRFVNRGFLYGPFCPIYGVGVLIIIFISLPVNAIAMEGTLLYKSVLFLGCFIATTVLEYVTGYFLEKFFNTTWWDYSQNFLNIKGRVCLSFSLLWGFGSYILVTYIHKEIKVMVESIPHGVGSVILIVLYAYFVIDFAVTIKSLIKFNAILTELKKVLKELKDEFKIGKDEIITVKLQSILENTENTKTLLMSKKKDLILKYFDLTNKIELTYSRFFLSFPNMKSQKFNQILLDLKEKISEKKEIIKRYKDISK